MRQVDVITYFVKMKIKSLKCINVYVEYRIKWLQKRITLRLLRPFDQTKEKSRTKRSFFFVSDLVQYELQFMIDKVD